MINALYEAMSADMGIPSIENEADDHFIYRLCYSALGQWCLNAARNKIGGIIGSTKQRQTTLLNDLLSQYIKISPNIASYFSNPRNNQVSASVFIRRAYEETGYLLTGEDNRNILPIYGRGIRFGEQLLFFGLPNNTVSINGLGVFTLYAAYETQVPEFLIRDSLTCEEYFEANFDAIFFDRDIDTKGLEYFNPLANLSPSKSWGEDLLVTCSVARKSITGPFYRVIKADDGLLFAEEPVEAQTESFASYEYRRLQLAIKAHYGKPLKAYASRLDSVYSRVRLEGHLPNREYYFLLLLSWPDQSAFDKSSFIIRSLFLKDALKAIEAIGIQVEMESPYV